MSTYRDRQLKVAIPPISELGQASPMVSPSPIVFSTRRGASVRRPTPSPTYRSTRKRVRPLPPVPRSITIPVDKELPDTPSPRRPLPSPPSASRSSSIGSPLASAGHSDTSRDSKLPILISPEFLTMSISPSQASLPYNRSRRRPDLRIQTFKTNLLPARPVRRPGTAPSPLTPSIPQAPSPGTTKLRRIAKLRRHLGESIPPELVYMKPAVKSRQLETIWNGEVPGQLHVRVHRVETVVRDEDDDSDGSWVTEEDAFHTEARRRYSRKWLKERAGRRWVEEDYQKILQALRDL